MPKGPLVEQTVVFHAVLLCFKPFTTLSYVHGGVTSMTKKLWLMLTVGSENLLRP